MKELDEILGSSNPKYYRIYKELIKKFQNINLDKDIYTEVHHILPRSLGGTDRKENLVHLPAREHMMAHLLLTRAFPDNTSLLLGANAMFSLMIGQREEGLKLFSQRTITRIKEETATLGFGDKFNTRTEYVKDLIDQGIVKTREDFEELMREKDEMTEALMDLYSKATSNKEREAAIIKYERDAKNSNYRSDYVAIDRHDRSHPIPVPNRLVRLSEKRAFDIQQSDYSDRFQLFNSLANYVTINTHVADFFIDFEGEGEFSKKMKLLCEYDFEEEELDYVLKQLPSEFAKYYYILGPNKIRALSCRRCNLEKEYTKAMFNPDTLGDVIYSIFNEGEKLSTQEIISRLVPIYEGHNNPGKPKAKDIGEYFEIKPALITQPDKTRVPGFKLIKRL